MVSIASPESLTSSITMSTSRIFLKLDLLQPSGSFKSRYYNPNSSYPTMANGELTVTRGIGNFIRTALQDPTNKGRELHFYISSGGNAGLAAVIAARDLNCQCTVVVPHSTKPMMVQKLRDVGAADVFQHGDNWFEADAHLRKTFIENQDPDSVKRNVYVPPFDHPDVWKGAETMIDEIARQMPSREEGLKTSFPADVVVCSVGGGGLFNGIVQGLGRYQQSQTREVAEGNKVRVLAVETKGADSLAFSLQNGSLQSLPGIKSLATSLGAVRVAPQALKNAQSPPTGVDVVSAVGSDAEAAKGVIRLADEQRLQVELACGISIELGTMKLKEYFPDLAPESRVVVVVCGGSNVSAEIIAEYRQKIQDGWE